MVLKIINLIKQVPDTHNITGEAMKPDGTINRSALSSITNPEDLNALEEALRIKDASDAFITMLSLGPPTAIKVLQESLYRGADDAVLVTDPKFAASDTLATSYALTCAIKRIGNYDLIICGRQAIDGDTAQVGPQIAEKLGINQLTCISKILEINANEIVVRREIEGGYEILRSKLPALITVVAEANEPRFPSAKKVMAYKKVTCKCSDSYDDAYIQPECGTTCGYVKQWNVADIKADIKFCGLAGSPTKVKNIQNVVLTARETKILSNSDEDISNLMHELIAEHIIG